MIRRLLVVGGSYAASELASSARENGYDGEIVIVSEEGELPYHRPPLSKAFLKGTAQTTLPLKAAAFYQANKIDIELGKRVLEIDLKSKSASLSVGPAIGFDGLAFAVGARARTLPVPGADLGNVHYLRSAADARALRFAANNAANIVIVGAGFIGLEVASGLASANRSVTVLEATDRALGRVVAEELSDFFSRLHASHGVKLLTSRGVKSLSGDNGIVRRVDLQDGTSLDADLVVIGIGSVPNCELADRMGLRTDNGIAVDGQCRTSYSNIFAAGDCTVFRNSFNTTGLRLESVQNAIDQSRTAGAVLAGVNKHHDPLPWFWSDQYDAKLQIAGLPFDTTERVVRAGSRSELSVFHFREEVCICVESVNGTREHMAARRVLPQRTATKAALLSVDFDIAALMNRGSRQQT